MTALIALIPYKEHAYTFEQLRSDFIEGGGTNVDKPTITKDGIKKAIQTLEDTSKPFQIAFCFPFAYKHLEAVIRKNNPGCKVYFQ